MKLVNLSEVCEITAGQAPPSKFYNKDEIGKPFIRVSSFGDPYPEIDTWTTKPLRECRDGDVLLSVAGTIGAVNLGINASITRSVFALRPNDKILQMYLYYFLKVKQKYFEHYAQGLAQRIITIKQVENLTIPLLSPSEQKRIVEILEEAESLRRKRQEASRVIDSGIMSIALNLFGDPIKNPRKWKISKFNEIALLERGRFGYRPRTEPRFYGGKYPFIQINDITKSGMIIKEYSQTLNEKGLAISKLFPANTVVVSIASTIGEVGILGFDSCFPDSLVGITPKEGVVTKEYIYLYLSYMKSHLNEIAPQLAQKNINLKILNNLNVLVPTFSEQKKFADLIQKVEEIKEKQQKSKQELDNLFNSLMQKTFNDE